MPSSPDFQRRLPILVWSPFQGTTRITTPTITYPTYTLPVWFISRKHDQTLLSHNRPVLALNCVAYHELLYLSRYAHIHIELLHVQPSGRGFLISDFYKTIKKPYVVTVWSGSLKQFQMSCATDQTIHPAYIISVLSNVMLL